MKQFNIFGQEEESKSKYVKKIEAPIYKPSNIKPHIRELYDASKTRRLIRQINQSAINEDIKEFLKIGAQRHTVFNYERIADYYAHADKETQRLMELSAMVIIDFERAIQLGYVRLSEDIKKEYLEINE